MPISGGLVSTRVAAVAEAAVAEAAVAEAAVADAEPALQVKSLRVLPFEHLQYTSACVNRFHSDERIVRTPVQPEVSESSALVSVDPESE
jgi:hypothetical protein